MAMRKFVLLLAAACLLSAKETLAFTSSLALHGAARARLPLRTCRMSAEIGVGAGTGAETGTQIETASASVSRQQLAQRIFEKDERPVILYDGVCNLCNGGVNFMLDFDKPDELRGNFRFAALQSEVGKALLQRGGRAPNDLSSIVLATHEHTYTESEAILRIGQGLGHGTPLYPWVPTASKVALALVPAFVRDRVYKTVSKNRYRFFGQSDECRLWDDRFDERFVPDVPEA